jgi:hypothetical protein
VPWFSGTLEVVGLPGLLVMFMSLSDLDWFEKTESVEMLIELLDTCCGPKGDATAEGGESAAAFGAKGFIVGFGAKGLNGELLGDLKGDAVAIGFDVKGFAVDGDAAVAKGFGCSPGAKRTVLSFCPPPREMLLPPRPLSIVLF